jgi:hypothetical protein
LVQFRFAKECGSNIVWRAFNTFNHPQFCPPDGTFGGTIFGQIFYTCNAPREVQMALKFYW